MANALKSRSATAERMKRYRDRRRLGLWTLPVTLSDAEIDLMVRNHFLEPGGRVDRVAIGKALHQLLAKAFERERGAGKVGRVSIQLHHEQLAHLVRLDYLAPRDTDDPEAVMFAFADLVYDALRRLPDPAHIERPSRRVARNRMVVS
jgi:hypothetical protein